MVYHLRECFCVVEASCCKRQTIGRAVCRGSQVGDAIFELKDRRKQDRIMKFFEATALGNMKNLNKMLDAGDIVINERDDNARTALHVAASVGNYKVAETLLARGADPNLVDSYKVNPFRTEYFGLCLPPE